MSKTVAYIDFIHKRGKNVYELEGYLGGAGADIGSLAFRANDSKLIKVKPIERKNTRDGIEYDKPVPGSTFTARVTDVKKIDTIEAILDGRRITIKPNRFTGLSRLSMSYRQFDGTILHCSYGRLVFTPNGRFKKVLFEARLFINILLNWRILDVFKRMQLKNGVANRIKYLVKSPLIIGEALVTIPEAYIVRLAYWHAIRKKQRPVWIISDRPVAAGDNGEALYTYLVNSKRVDEVIDYYYVISKKSPDYTRIKQLGRVLVYGSLRYKVMTLIADELISSQADLDTTNPFGRQINRYVDLFHFEFVFLQHGIIRHDLSNWLNRFSRNISLFVTSAKLEYDSIINGKYSYDNQQVILTGLPRYDLLKNSPKGKLILAPTYRADLLQSDTNRLGERIYSTHFKDSEYATFYRNFMNDERIISCMKKYGFTGELLLHPVLESQATDFNENDVFTVAKFPHNYQKAFEEGNLLISDHSSVMFDFAYLKKPVAYAHFDAESFYTKHTYTKSDFFSDDQQGFGPVCNDYDDLVTETVKMLEKGPTMSNVYLERVDNFFEYNDRGNSERVVDAILSLQALEENA